MLRQIANLRRFGRIRTVAKTPRRGRPALLQQQPELEVTDLLGMVARQHGRADHDFTFVQIGAFDGRTGDPLYSLAHQRNWRGVLVEPQPGPYNDLCANYAAHSGVQCFNVAIGPEDGTLTLYRQPGGDGTVSSVTRQLVVKPGRGRQVEEIQVPCWTFDRLLNEAQLQGPIDLLQIDAEGFDFEIIKSIDFAHHRPRILRYEHQILSQSDRNACLALLASHGYRFLLEDCDTTAILSECLEESAAEAA